MASITIIIATYNCGAVLKEAIDSVIGQDFPKKELIVVDGGSTDETLDIIRSYSNAISWWRSEPDNGIFDAWNKGIAASHGDWVHFMGGDDKYTDPNALTQVARSLALVQEGALICYGRVNLIDQRGGIRGVLGKEWNARDFRSVGMTIPHQGVFHRRALFEKYGNFDTSDRATGTYELLLRYLKNHDAHFLGSDVIVDMRLGGLSSNPRYHLAFILAYVRAQKRHGTFRLRGRMLFALANGICKKLLFVCLPEKMAIFMWNFIRTLVRKHYPNKRRIFSPGKNPGE